MGEVAVVNPAAAADTWPNVASDEVGRGPVLEFEVHTLLPTVQELPF